MFDKQFVFAVRLALEARFLFHRVFRTKGGRSRLLQRLEVFHKDERLENRPERQNKAQKTLNSGDLWGFLAAEAERSALPLRVWGSCEIVHSWQRRIAGNHWHHASCCHEHTLHVDATIFIPQYIHHGLSSDATCTIKVSTCIKFFFFFYVKGSTMCQKTCKTHQRSFPASSCPRSICFQLPLSCLWSWRSRLWQN